MQPKSQGNFDGREPNFIKEELATDRGLEIVYHEYSHSLLLSIRKANIELWKSLQQEIDTTPDGQRVKDYVLEVYPKFQKSYNDTGKLSEDAYEEMVVTLMGALISRRLRPDNFLEVLRKFREDKGERLDHLLSDNIQVEQLENLPTTDIADLLTLGTGKINVNTYIPLATKY